jgi:hypothetical protein
MDRRNNDVVFAKLENLSGNGDLILYTNDLTGVIKPFRTLYHFFSPLSKSSEQHSLLRRILLPLNSRSFTNPYVAMVCKEQNRLYNIITTFMVYFYLPTFPVAASVI